MSNSLKSFMTHNESEVVRVGRAGLSGFYPQNFKNTPSLRWVTVDYFPKKRPVNVTTIFDWKFSFLYLFYYLPEKDRPGKCDEL